MLSFLDGISPFHWLSLALALGGAVMLTSADVLLWPAAASLVIGLLLFAVPEMPGEAQIILFAGLSVCAVVGARVWLPRLGDGGKAGASLNDPLTRLAGRTGTVTEAEGRRGRIVIDGVRWSARWAGGEASLDSEVEVVGHEGATLIVQECSRN